MQKILSALGLSEVNPGGFSGTWTGSGKAQRIISPIQGETLATVTNVTPQEFEAILAKTHAAFQTWRLVPAPKRGEVVKALGDELRKHKAALAELVTLEMGKTLREGLGEVQEMIDICDFAVGLSRQLYGLTMPSERKQHRLQEQWHPLGVVGVITAFNFPVAVWSWNTALALVCGDTVLWKPSSKTPLTAIACTKIAEKVLRDFGFDPAICSLAIGKGSDIGDLINTDPRVALVSYTGSVPGGRHVGSLVQQRFGRHILELGGNGAVIVSDKADLDIALRSIYFGAIGTSGQRCTSTRRVIVQESVLPAFRERLLELYRKTPIGDPRENKHLMGPLVDQEAVATMLAAIATVKAQGGKVLHGGEKLANPGGCYITPCLVEVPGNLDIVKEETFAPVLYLMPYRTIEEAIALQNGVSQGLSSAIITNDQRESELFLSAAGSDCGLANVNTGTSGAEIGGAFGGEKETGGGRESGSDAWKAYMRRQTSAINFSGQVELAQGITLEI
ncbi:aldehyde dehydrogenase family protein [Geothrix sp. PMB-07]|uniref:L-piperidine-6-carboxylate dehydrogenase n=1 Tax=Geothrix sp. PMB-07 TaxID=3068640 RepID=UPI0027424BA8|nr:aldehyde dehydrogenase family protein [Geothrix sp. PMB-07]WLT32164.1 aldehyde dehydrogenase family protein [Geothrix sp. PMB-07]